MSAIPLISVIIPCYRCSKTLPDTLKSLKNQTFQDFEVILINDCDGDALTRKCMEEANDIFGRDRVKLIFNSKNMGPGRSRNVGINAASGRYIALLDSDDKFLPDKLESDVSFLTSNPDVDVICSYLIRSDKKNGKTKQKEIKIKKLVYKNIIATSTVVAKNKEWFRFNEEHSSYAEDFDVWCTLLGDNKKIMILDYRKTEYGYSPGQESKKLKEVHAGIIYVLKKIRKDRKISFLTYHCSRIFENVKYIKRIIRKG